MSVYLTVNEVDFTGDWLVVQAENVMLEMQVADTELSLVLCDDTFIHGLNRDYRGFDKPTDVLSFSQREGEGADPDDPVLGDVIISIETAVRQAEFRGHSLARELTVLMVHGVLHLLGFDHIEDDEALIMEAKEVELLKMLD